MELNIATQEIVKQLPNVNNNLINQFIDNYVESLTPVPKTPFYIDININRETSQDRQTFLSTVSCEEALTHYKDGEPIYIRLLFSGVPFALTAYVDDFNYREIPLSEFIIPIHSLTKDGFTEIFDWTIMGFNLNAIYFYTSVNENNVRCFSVDVWRDEK